MAPRRHGCESPHNFPQVACVVIFFFLLSGFYVFYVPVFLETWQAAVAGGLYSLTIFITAVLFLWTSFADPTEYGTNEESEGKEGEEQYYCVICQVHVHKHSKHCRSCDRCVEGFDHHCKWLNNCVGSKNYKGFFSLVCVTCAMILQQFACSVYLLAISVLCRDEVAAKLESVFGRGIGLAGFRGAQGVFCALTLPPALLLGELLFFHLLLMYKGMSTYEYIMAQRALKQDAEDAEHADGAGGTKKGIWKLKMFTTGAVSPEADTPTKVRVSLSPLQLLKMKGHGGTGCGCRASPLGGLSRGGAHLVPLETTSAPLLPGMATGSNLAEGRTEQDVVEVGKELFPYSLSPGERQAPTVNLAKLAVVPSLSSLEEKPSKPTLPPMNPLPPHKAFDQ